MKELFKQIGRSDIPISSKETDVLFPNNYVTAFKEYIKNCETPMTISIQGEWGIGKTSFVNLIMSDEEIKKIFDFISFDVWDYSQFDMADKLPLLMLNYLCEKVSLSNNMLKKVIKTATSIGGKFIANKTLSDIDAFDDIFNSDAIHQLSTMREDFNNAVKERLNKVEKEKLLIFIDNLDRVSPEKALELIEVLKTFLDSKNVVFVLAIDYDVVIKGANAKYGEEKGKVFFDKVIQLPFNMPVEYYNVDKYFEDKINKAFPDNEVLNIPKENKKEYLEIAKIVLGTNPRTINRIINSFTITMMVDYLSVDNKNQYELKVTELLFFLLCLKFEKEKIYQYFIYYTYLLKDDGIDKYVNKCSDIKEITKLVGDDSGIELIVEKFINLIKDIDNRLKNTGSKLHDVLTRPDITGGKLNIKL